MNQISVRNISKRFGETHALVDANLETKLGEIHAIVGENGSGKSTLAKIISGVILPDSGDVDVLGVAPDCPSMALGAGISTIYQEMMLAEELSIVENLYAGVDGLWKKVVPTAVKYDNTQQILERLTQAEIDPDAIVSSLPLNIKQWIVIARAILQKPKLLIFDESSAALDLEATNRLHIEMKRLKDAGSCVILVTHRIAELVKITDTATVLRDGVTVGELGAGEITEKNLLELMSAAPTTLAKPREQGTTVPSKKTVLETQGLRVRQGAKAIDFTLKAGEIVGLVGLDGAGQKEFVRNLVGIEEAIAGRVTGFNGAANGCDIRNLKQAEQTGIAYVSGDRKRVGIFPNLSILENFGMALMNQINPNSALVDQRETKRAFEKEVDRLGIKFGRLSDKITTLSGGNQQKVLLPRVFSMQPNVIVLNDPARGVDIGTKQDLYKHLKAFVANGGAVIYLTSEIEELFDLADRADVFFDGTVFRSFPREDINEEKLLSAMFGQEGHIEFDMPEDTTSRRV